jgi:putative ATPase
VQGALLSRVRVFVFKQLDDKSMEKIIKRGMKSISVRANKKSIDFLISISNGDARVALNILEYASFQSKEIDIDIIKEAAQKTSLIYDKNGEEHYNIISALHKSMRGSDANASLYWLARLVEGGEDPLYIARRIIRFAAEDIGLANSRALDLAVNVYNACHYIGYPECDVVLAEAVVYMAKSKKSNELYVAYNKAKEDIRKTGNLCVPLHLRNATTKLMDEIGYGKGYKYSPDYKYEENQEYMPEKLKNRKYFKD